MKPKSIKRRILIIIALIVTITDQISKYWANDQLTFNQTKGFIPYIIQLRLTRNTGAAFSLFTNLSEVLSIISLLVSVALTLWIILKPALDKALTYIHKV